MDKVIRTHKEITFGWARLVQQWLATGKAWLACRAREQATKAIGETQAKPRRYLAPR